MDRPEARSGLVATAAMAVGGFLAFLGPFFTWGTLSLTRRSRSAAGGAGASPSPQGGGGGRAALERLTGRSATVQGLDTGIGRAIFALAIALAVVAILAYLSTRLWYRLAGVSIGVVLGAVVLVLAIVDLSSPVDLPAQILRRAPVGSSPGFGLYLAIIGSALAVLAGVAWLVMNRGAWAGAEARPQPPSPDSEPSTSPGLASE